MVKVLVLFISLLTWLTCLANQTMTSPVKPKIPSSCAVWFDGCNQCRVGIDPQTGKQLLACTRKYCPPKTRTEAKCLQQRKKHQIIETRKHTDRQAIG